ncbi:hypothetical protein [Nitrosomonas sp.]|uniref:hypothetical protein n=1 Tax=Nitrosomonas sp. TaxID=42353 RepID=UPI0025D91341|nr:hypothetical protein [Nitrosomonas sp.]
MKGDAIIVDVGELKNFVDLVQSIATTGAIVIGGIWTYFLFIKNRLNYPQIELKIACDQYALDHGKKLIHTTVTLKNTGKVMLYSRFAEIRLRQVLPLPIEVNERISQNYDLLLQDQTQVEWPLIAARQWHWDSGEFEIEPEESDAVHTEFVVDASVTLVQFYFFIKNAKKQNLGWSLAEMHKLESKEEKECAAQK